MTETCDPTANINNGCEISRPCTVSRPLLWYVKHHHKHTILKKVDYSQLCLRRTPLGPALSVRLIENQIKGVKKGRDQI